MDYNKALAEYRSEWEQTHKRPKRSKPHLMDYLQFLIFVPIAIVGPLVSAFRTAALVNAHTAFRDPRLALAETLGATFLFEAAALIYQFERLRRKAEGKEKLPEIGTFWIVVGMIAAVGAVTISNLVEIGVASLTQAGVEVPQVIPAIAIGLFIGGGIPVMTIVAGEIGGRFLLEYQVEDKRLRLEHEKALVEWEEQFTRSWDRVKRRRLAGTVQPVEGDRAVTADSVRKVAKADGQPADSDQTVAEDSDRQLRTSEALAGHLSAIRQAVADRQQFGGNGTFKRADVETWQGVSSSQAKNILTYGREHGLVELVGGGKYRFREV